MYKKPIIVFEGIECSGKSYHIKNVSNYLKKKKIKFIKIREPGGSQNSEKIRKLILNNKSNFDKFTDLLLYMASRNENFNNILLKNYNKKIILIDRFIDSTIAYQAYGLNVNRIFIERINNYILNNFKPDLVIYLYANKQVIRKRLNKRINKNRYDKFSFKFYQKVHHGYLSISKKRKNFIKVNTSDSAFSVQKKILGIIEKKIKLWKKK